MLITLPLHVMRELGKALGLALLVFTFVMLTVASGQVLRDGVGLVTLLGILPKLFPMISPMVLPITIVTGTLVCYGRLAGNNEYTAAQASGVHPGWLATPAIVVALLATSITLYLNDTVLTESTQSIRDAILADKTDILRRRLSKPGSFNFGNYAICRLKREGDSIGIDVTTFAMKGEDREQKTSPRWDPDYPHQENRWIARDHRLDLHENEQGRLFVKAYLTDFQFYDPIRLQPRGSAKAVVNLSTGEEGKEISFSPERITFWGFQRLQEKMEVNRVEMVRLDAQIEALDPAAPEYAAQFADLKSIRADRDKSVFKLTAELHFKLALSFSCLGFALLGIPLGLRSRAQRATVGFVIGLGVAGLFFLVTKGLQVSARVGQLPAATIWLPAIALYVLGAVMWARLRRAE